LWKKEVVDTYWCDKAEYFFDNRLRELESDNPQPLSSEAWRQRIKSTSTHRAIVTNAMKVSNAFIKSKETLQ